MKLLCFFAHHRCGSSWTNDMLRAICDAAGWRHRVVHNAQMMGGDPGRFCLENRVDLHHHYRAGTPGDWRNHFCEELRSRFKQRYNDVLITLGYELNADG